MSGLDIYYLKQIYKNNIIENHLFTIFEKKPPKLTKGEHKKNKKKGSFFFGFVFFGKAANKNLGRFFFFFFGVT